MGKLEINILEKEEIIRAQDMLYALHKDTYCPRGEYRLLMDEKSNLEKEKEELIKKIDEIEGKLERIQSFFHEYECNSVEQLKVKIREIETERDRNKNRLNEMGVDVDGVNLDKKGYYNVVDGRLEETTDNRAFYFAVKKGANYEFGFNENAPHQRAIDLKNYFLYPFCDIVSLDPNPTFIELLEIGTFEGERYMFKVTKKAKICLKKR